MRFGVPVTLGGRAWLVVATALTWVPVLLWFVNWGIAPGLLFPLIVATLPYLGASRQQSRFLRILSLIGLVGFMLLGLASVATLFLPAAASLTMSVILMDRPLRHR